MLVLLDLLLVSVLVLSPLDVVVPETVLLVPDNPPLSVWELLVADNPSLPVWVLLVADNPPLPVWVLLVTDSPPLLGVTVLRVGIVHVPRLRLMPAVPPGKGSGVFVHFAGSGAALKESL